MIDLSSNAEVNCSDGAAGFVTNNDAYLPLSLHDNHFPRWYPLHRQIERLEHDFLTAPIEQAHHAKGEV